MKKILMLVLLLFVVSGCSALEPEKIVRQTDVKGYWVQLERNWSGDIDDMSDDPYAYIEITDNKLFFYTESSIDKGYYDTIAEKFYILKDNTLYYDYYELKGDNWEKKISDFGGILTVSFDDKYLVLTENYGDSAVDGYEKNTYKKVKDVNRLLDPQALMD